MSQKHQALTMYRHYRKFAQMRPGEEGLSRECAQCHRLFEMIEFRKSDDQRCWECLELNAVMDRMRQQYRRGRKFVMPPLLQQEKPQMREVDTLSRRRT